MIITVKKEIELGVFIKIKTKKFQVVKLIRKTVPFLGEPSGYVYQLEGVK